MKRHDIKLTLARHDPSTNLSAPWGGFLQLIGPDRLMLNQEKSKIGGKIKCWSNALRQEPPIISWNLGLPCNMYMTFKILTGEEEETSRQQLGPFTRKLQRNNKNPTSFFHLANKKSARTELGNDGRMRLTWHSKQQKKRQGKNGRCDQRETIKPDGTYIHTVNSFHLQHSSVRHWKPSSILVGSLQQSMKISFLMEVIPQDLALASPFAFPAFWSAFLLSARSFFPASLWKLFFSWLKRSEGSSRTINKGQCESVSRSRRRRRRRTSLVKKRIGICFFNTLNFYFLKHRGIMEVVCTPLFVHGHARTREMPVYSHHQCS